MVDIILCYVPKLDIQTPIIGLPILKAVLTKHGYKSKILDFNIKFYKQYKDIFPITNWDELDSIFIEKNDILKNMDFLYNKWVDTILYYNPKFVGFSAFSDHNSYSIELLAKKIKDKKPNIKIVLGGPNTKWIYKYLIDKKLIDYYIIGYGEDAILKIMKNKFINIDVAQPRIDLSIVPIPDFSDYSFNDFSSKNLFYTYFTRGCTQSCKFCDVNSIWNKFNTRTPDTVIKEMKYINDKYKFARFAFCDSLLNGDKKILRELCVELSKENYRWEGMFRIRKTNDYDFELLKKAGCYLLKIGIESGSVKIRQSMGKYFSNELIFKVLLQLKEAQIKCDLFFITGYNGETDEDYKETKKLLREIATKGYIDIISNIRISAMYFRKDELKIYEDDYGYKKRYDRYHDLRKYVYDLGFHIRRDKKMLTSIKIREKLGC